MKLGIPPLAKLKREDWQFLLQVFVPIALALILVASAMWTKRAPADECAEPGVLKSKFGSARMCEFVRAKIAEGLDLSDCVEQDGHHYCIMIDRRAGNGS